MDLCWQSNFSIFNMLYRLVIAFLPRSKRLLISWLQSPSAVIFEPRKIKSATLSTVSPSICHEVMGPDAMIFVFWMLSFKPNFLLSSFTFIKRPFSSSSLSAIRVVSSAYLRLLIFLLVILILYYQHNNWYFLSIHSMSKSFLAFFSDHYNRPVGWCYYCMHAKSLEFCLTLWDPMDCSLPGSSVHGIFQARILEWVAISSSSGQA